MKDKPNSTCLTCGSPSWICATDDHCTNPRCPYYDPMVEAPAPAEPDGIQFSTEKDLTRAAESETAAAAVSHKVTVHFDGNPGHTFRIGDQVQHAKHDHWQGQLIDIHDKEFEENKVDVQFAGGSTNRWLATELRPIDYEKPEGFEITAVYLDGCDMVSQTFRRGEEVMHCATGRIGTLVARDHNTKLVKVKCEDGRPDFWTFDSLRPATGNKTVTDGGVNIEGITLGSVPTAHLRVDCNGKEGDYQLGEDGRKIVRIFAEGTWVETDHLQMDVATEDGQCFWDGTTRLVFTYSRQKGWHVPGVEATCFVRLYDMTVQKRREPLTRQ